MGKWEMRGEQVSGSKWHLLFDEIFNELPQSESQPTPDRPRPLTIPITTTLRRMNTPLATHALKKKKNGELHADLKS